MSAILSFLFGEIVQPFITGVGWLLVMLFTLGRVKPTKETFYKYPLISLLGLYFILFGPAVAIVLYKMVQS